MTTLVLGGGGFIGRDVTRRLSAAGTDVVCADIARPDALPDGVEFVDCDVRIAQSVEQVFRRYEPTCVVHLAYMLTAETAARPRYAVEVNCQGMANVLEAAVDVGVERVVYASSIAAYGALESAGPIAEETPVTAAFSNYPVSLYAATKQFNEYQARHYADAHDVTIAGVRPGVVFGPGRSSGAANWASSFVSLPARGEEGHIPVAPDEELSMVYRDDVAALFVALHDADSIDHHAYNTGGHCVTVRELAELVSAELDGTVTWDDDGEPLGLVADLSHERARSEFGYELTPLVDTVRHHAAAVVDDA